MTKQQLETIKRQYQPLAPSPVLDLVAEVERLQAENERLRICLEAEENSDPFEPFGLTWNEVMGGDVGAADEEQ